MLRDFAKFARSPRNLIHQSGNGQIGHLESTSFQTLEEYGDLDLSCTTATSCDTDSIFAPRYFENLGYQFLTSPKAKEVVWQAPLYYNHFLNERPFYVRAIGIMRAAYMLGFLIPFNINTMSIFSFSLDLCIKGEFFHAHYQMDDIIYTLTCILYLPGRFLFLIHLNIFKSFFSGETAACQKSAFSEISAFNLCFCSILFTPKNPQKIGWNLSNPSLRHASPAEACGDFDDSYACDLWSYLRYQSVAGSESPMVFECFWNGPGMEVSEKIENAGTTGTTQSSEIRPW